MKLASLLVAFLLAAEAGAADDTLEQRLKACAVCHGERGEGLTKSEYYPRLAGKPAGYLFNQLVAFRELKRRSPIMNYLVAQLSDAYLREISEHYARLNPAYPPPTPRRAPRADRRSRRRATVRAICRRAPPATAIRCTACSRRFRGSSD